MLLPPGQNPVNRQVLHLFVMSLEHPLIWNISIAFSGGYFGITQPPSPLLFFNSMFLIWGLFIFSCDQFQALHFKFIYFCFKRASGRGQRERGTEDPKRVLCWQQRAWCGAWTHEPWDRDPSRSRMLNRLSHPAAPPNKFILRQIMKPV